MSSLDKSMKLMNIPIYDNTKYTDEAIFKMVLIGRQSTSKLSVLEYILKTELLKQKFELYDEGDIIIL
jgi:hypothetical protein